MPGFQQNVHEPQGQRDHGRPTHQAIWTGGDGNPIKEWVYCPVCLAVKDGWFGDGTPRFSGGTIRIQYQLENGAKRTFLAACSCEHGLRVQELWEQHHQAAGAILPFRSYRLGQKLRIPNLGPAEIVDIIIPGEGKGVTVRRIGEEARSA